MDSQTRADEQVLKEAQSFVRKNQSRLERNGKEISEEVYKRIQTKLNELRHAIKENDTKRIKALLESCEELIDEHLGPVQKSTWREYAESIGLAILFAFILRGFVIEAFKIPTGSMIPTLLVGDHLFVNKFIYGIRVPFTQKFLVRFEEPDRGEVVVFTFPREEAKAHIAKKPISKRECIDRSSLEEEKDFIKRIVGVAGDTIELKNNQLIINNEPIKRTHLRKETTGNFLFPHNIQEFEKLGDYKYVIQYAGSESDFGPIRVEDGHVFVMGDHRDNSSDSRCWGQVPVDNIKGRAMIIWWSVPQGNGPMRWDRIGQLIHRTD